MWFTISFSLDVVILKSLSWFGTKLLPAMFCLSALYLVINLIYYACFESVHFQGFSLIFILSLFYYFETFLKVTEKKSWCFIWQVEAAPKEKTFNFSVEMSDSSWISSAPAFHLANFVCLFQIDGITAWDHKSFVTVHFALSLIFMVFKTLHSTLYHMCRNQFFGFGFKASHLSIA